MHFKLRKKKAAMRNRSPLFSSPIYTPLRIIDYNLGMYNAIDVKYNYNNNNIYSNRFIMN